MNCGSRFPITEKRRYAILIGPHWLLYIKHIHVIIILSHCLAVAAAFVSHSVFEIHYSTWYILACLVVDLALASTCFITVKLYHHQLLSSLITMEWLISKSEQVMWPISLTMLTTNTESPDITCSTMDCRRISSICHVLGCISFCKWTRIDPWFTL